MENTFWTALGASSLAVLVTAIGIYTIRHFEAWGRKYSIYFICFAAGVLISVSFLHIIPKSFEMNANAPVYPLIGFVFLHLFNRFVTTFVCERDPDSRYGIGLVPCSASAFIRSLMGSSTPPRLPSVSLPER
jgi:ZIP family zinc transporter/zinc and cadmium transporter